MKNLFLLSFVLFSRVLFAQTPINDECSGAIELVPSYTRTYSAGTLVGATQSSPNGCVAYTDIFYKYVATSTINVITVIPGPGLDISLSLYSSCSAATPISCANLYGYNSTETITSINQIIGNSYYIRVGNAMPSQPSYNPPTFTIAVVTPPINTTCDGAINIIPSTSCTYTNGNLTEALSLAAAICPMNERLFYKFTAVSPSTDITFTSDDAFDLTAALYSSCNATGALYCIPGNVAGGKKIAAVNLIVGNTYYVQVGATYTVGSNVSKNFGICIQSMPVKANDECANAATITPSPTCNFINGDLAGASRSVQPVGCVSYQDVFYKFTATSQSATISLKTSSGLDLNAMLFSDCQNTGSAICVNNAGINSDEVIFATNLTIGNTYYLSIGSVWVKPLTTNFSVCIKSDPLPVNDECLNAIDITPSEACTNINSTLTGATTSATNGCLMDRDIFYKFTATTTKASITLTTDAGLNVSAGLYSSCAATTPLYCSINSGTISPKTISAANLVIGNVYYIKVGSYKYAYPTNLNFSMCVQLPPTNDECAGAVSITPSTTCSMINGDLFTATQSTANGCSMYKDLFYKFVAVSASTDLTFKASSGLNIIASLYNDCAATTPLYCSSTNYSTAWSQKITATNLIVGNTYYIKVGSIYSAPSATTFSFCVQTIPVPVNDECVNAINLAPVATCTYVNGDLAGASQSTANGCSMYQDVFYKFTAAATTASVSFNSSSDLNLVASVYSDCATATPLYCLANTYTLGGIKTIAATNLIIGNTYYIKVGNAVATPPLTSTFGICVQNYTPVANDEIINATSITPSATCNTISGDLAKASHSPANGCDMITDVFYQFVAASSVANIAVTPSSGLQSTVSLFESTSATTPIICVNGTLGSINQFNISNLVAGNTYYVKVGSYTYSNPTTTTFNLCIKTMQLPVNDLCTNAIEIIPSVTPVFINGDMAFSTETVPAICSNAGAKDVFYKFTAIGPTATITPQTSSGLSLLLSLFDNCTATTALYCGSGGGPIAATNLIVGNTYYVKVTGMTAYYLPTTTFAISIQSAPAPVNDDCPYATPIVSGTSCNTTTGDLTGASYSGANGCSMINDVFYKFVATSSSTEINLTASAGLNIAGALYASCAATTPLYCIHDSYSYGNTEKIFAGNLIIGNTYYIKAGSFRSNPTTSNFTICVKSITAAANDECVNAISITPGTTCNSITGDLTGGAQSTMAGCTTYYDIFYKFVATTPNSNITFTPSQNLNLNVGIYANCSATTALYCNYAYGGTTQTITASGLTIGNTYYIKAGSTSSALLASTFSLCVQTLPIPSNDECTNALTITPSTTCVYTNGDLSTASQSVANGCTSYKDLFYKFVAQTPNTDIAFAASSGLNIIVSLQADCNSTTPLYCINNTTAGSSNIISATNLVPGSIYYIKIGSNTAAPTTSAFSICVRSGLPPNDDFTGATTVAPGVSCVSTIGSLANATTSPANGCSMYKDVFYKFVAAAPHYKIYFTPSANLDLTAALYSSTNSTVPLTCVNNTGVSGLESVKALDLTIGSTYYVKVGSVTISPVSNDFTFCIQSTQATNDECAAAISITPSATCNYITGDLDFATKSLLNGFDEGKDVFYKFIANSNSVIISTAPQGNSSIGISLLSSCTKKVFSTYDTMRVDNLVIGNTYYVQLRSSIYNASSAYSLCIQSFNIPDNDECVNAILIPSSYIAKSGIGESIFVDLSQATKSTQNSCSQTIYKDRYYKFVAKSATLTMNFNNTFNLFSGITLGCGSTAEVKLCGTNSYGGSAWGIFNMVVGETYYLKLGTLDSAPTESTFSFSLGYVPDKPLPINDGCAGALTLIPNTTRSFTQGNLQGALRTVTNDNCWSATKDVFYKFVASSPSAKIVLKPGQSIDYVMGLNGSCPATQASSLYCKTFSGSDSIMATNLTVGNTYYIKIACDQAHVDSNPFEILVEAFAPPINDGCAGALTIVPSAAYNYVTADLGMASKSNAYTGCSATNKDVFYKFTAITAKTKIVFKPRAGGSMLANLSLYSDCSSTTPLYCETGSAIDSIMAENLVIGNTYYIKAGSVSTGSSDTLMYLCVQSVAINDVCANATTIIPLLTCNPTTGDLTLATPSASNNYGCTGYGDVFYKFVATSKKINITFTTSTFLSITASLYSDCNIQASHCIPFIGKNNSGVMGDTSFVIGNTYYIKVANYDPGALLSSTFTLCVQNVPTTNDEFASALTITPGTTCTSTSGDLINATQSAANGCSMYKDLFYKFVATAPSSNITVTSSADLDIVAGLYVSTNTTTPISCVNATGKNAAETIAATNLTVGNTYYVRVGSFNSTATTTTFAVCVQSIQAPNDEFASALTITPGTTCTSTSGDLINATQSAANGCSMYKDLFYKFVATAPSSNITVTSSADLDIVAGLYVSTNTTTPISCVNATGKNAAETIAATNLTVGNTYYVRVGSFNSTATTTTFAVCVQSIQAPNDEFASAVTITPGTICSYTNGDLINATQSAANGCSLYKDLFYKFVATTPSSNITVTSSADLDIVAGLYVSTNTTTPISCVNATGKNVAETITATNLTVGSTYYVRVGSFNSTATTTTFAVCVQSIQAPNDEYASALTITPGTTCTSTSGDLINATQSTANGCSMYKDLFYKFVATAPSSNIKVTSSADLDIVAGLYVSTNTTTPINCVNATGKNVAETIAATNLTVGNTYYVRVGSFNSTATTTTFAVCVQSIQAPNDEFASALTITPATTCTSTSGDLINATQSNANGCSMYKDLFYKFVATAPSSNITVTSSADLDIVAGLYVSTNTTTPISCVNATGKNVAETITATNLTIGSTYYVRVGSFNSTATTTTFAVCVQSIQAPNDEYASALTITPGTTCTSTSGDLINATQSTANGCSMYKDLFYKFVATAPSSNITVTSSADLDIVAGLYVSTNTTTPINCVNATGKNVAETIAATNLTVGNTYYVRVGSFNSTATTTTFAVCVQSIQALNDECSNAITLTPAINILFTPGDLSNSSKSSSPSTCIPETDIFYKFTATNSTAKIIVENSSGLDAVVSVFTSCASSSDIVCQNNTGPGETEEVILSSLVPGSTYYIMIGSVSSSNSRISTSTTTTFNIAIQEISIATAVATSQILKNIHIYPNPSYGNIHVSNIVGLTTIEIMGMDGKMLCKKEISSDGSIDMEVFPSGIYMIRFTYNDIPEIRRIEIIR